MPRSAQAPVASSGATATASSTKSITSSVSGRGISTPGPTAGRQGLGGQVVGTGIVGRAGHNCKAARRADARRQQPPFPASPTGQHHIAPEGGGCEVLQRDALLQPLLPDCLCALHEGGGGRCSIVSVLADSWVEWDAQVQHAERKHEALHVPECMAGARPAGQPHFPYLGPCTPT